MILKQTKVSKCKVGFKIVNIRGKQTTLYRQHREKMYYFCIIKEKMPT